MGVTEVRRLQILEEGNRKLLVNMLDATYINTKKNLIIAGKPKPPLRRQV